MSLVMLCSSDVYTLINYTSFVESGFIGISVAGLLYLRYKYPDMHRPIKVRTNAQHHLGEACFPQFSAVRACISDCVVHKGWKEEYRSIIAKLSTVYTFKKHEIVHKCNIFYRFHPRF